MYLEIIKKRTRKSTSGFVEVTLSDFLPANFVESDLELDLQVPRDDATFVLQMILNQASENRTLLLHWDKAVAISDTLYLNSNTTINFSTGKGLVLKAGVSKPALRNKNVRPTHNSLIVDRNIKLLGSNWIINGNAPAQNRGTNGFGMTSGMSFLGVENLEIDGVRIFNHKVYATQCLNIKNGIMRNFRTDIGYLYTSFNQDGVHWDGWCTNCLFENGIIRSNDDAIAINADDGYSKWAGYPLNAGYLDNFYDESFSGPVDGITIRNITINNSSTDHGYGVRILSSTARVDNILIEGLHGTCNDYFLLIDTYEWYPGTIDFSGIGDVGSVVVDNFTGQVVAETPNQIPRAKISTTCSIEELIATNVTPNTLSSVPLVAKINYDVRGRQLIYGTFNINGINY